MKDFIQIIKQVQFSIPSLEKQKLNYSLQKNVYTTEFSQNKSIDD